MTLSAQDFSSKTVVVTGTLSEMTRKEVRATHVLQVPLDQASVKVRFDGVGDTEDDGEDHTVWAGVVPLAVRAGTPIGSPVTRAAGAADAASVAAFAQRLHDLAAEREARLREIMQP